MKPHLNKGLFSNYYLDELLPKEEEFNISFSLVETAFDETKRIWDKTYLSSLSEPQLRKHFLDKVFEILGWTIDVEPPTPSGEWSKHPDYALFHTREDLKIAQKATKEDYFNKAFCIGEAKRWGRPLDRKLRGEKDPFEAQNPSLQISRYLWLTGVRWGILTDGKHWRVFERETAKRLDVFYEIDVEDLIENGSTEDFKYFYLFFRRDAFPDFLEKVYKESVDYAEAVGEELKENVYHALKTLTQGFLSTPANKLKDTQLKEIHDNSLILLYRLLFILYAEYRGLLPIGENRFYTESYSLDSLKKEVVERLDKGEPIAASTYGYWNKLKELFEIINIGNSELGVPPYNGGLFDPEKYDFLEKYRIGNLYIAKAVDLLSRSSDRAYIDYGSLEIRHLGSIYEGLLEYKLKIADEDIVPVKEKGKEVFIPVEEAAKQKKKIEEEYIVREGEVYLVTDKGERKATGSYYTPDYIVKYIIENTLGPLVERIYKEIEWAQEIKNTKGDLNEIFEEIIKENGEEDKENLLRLWKMTRSNQDRRDFLLNVLDGAQPSHGYDPIERILQFKVLDPAMGSGHFLVEATDFLARELLRVLSGEPLGRSLKEMEIKEAQEPYGKTEPEEEEIRWARREVVERCIFGVDLNPLAVELGKLSLWLYTVSKDRPLNFLDHHLRCGNSLIGANISDLTRFPELKKKKAKKGPVQIGLFESVFREKVSILLKSFELIETHPSDTVEQIREKERLYQDFRGIVSRFQDVADVWTSVYFGNEFDFGTYQRLQGELRSSDEEWEKFNQKPWFKKAKDIAEGKNFFHWDLEFPEVFFEGDQRKENPGFDAVVGNPPYGSVLTREERSYTSVFYESSGTTFDVFGLFIERGTSALKNKQSISFIVPSGWLTALEHIHLRTFILSSQCPQAIVHLPYDVFPDAYIDCIVYVARKQKPYAANICLVKRFGIREGITAMPHSVSDYESINISPWLTDIDKLMVTEKNVGFWMIKWSQSDNFLPAGEIIKVSRGISPFKKAMSNDSRYTANGFFGSVRRYNLQPEEFTPVVYDTSLSEYKPPEFFYGKRLIIRRIISRQHRIQATLVTNDFVMNKSYLPAIITSDEYLLEYVLAIFNSRLLSRAFVSMSEIAKRDDFPQLDIATVRKFPIRRIKFTTPKNERYHILEKGKQLYEQYLSQKDSDSIFKFVDYQLCQIPECTDVMHYLLAFLVEQMNDMNANNREEIKGLLAWLESQLKIQPDKKGETGIEALTGKTHIKNYLGDYQKGEEHLSFEEFWKILEKNKNRIRANLKSREIFERVKTEYKKSLSRLLPIKENLRKTDWLIDQTVYKLYGLTEEEIQLVENVL